MTASHSPADGRVRARRHARQRPRHQGPGHAHRRGRPGRATLEMTRARRHAQRPRHLPWRLHHDAGRLGLRLRLQLVQRADRGLGLLDRLHRAGARRRRADRALPRGLARPAAPASTTPKCTNQRGERIAMFRGRSYTAKGKPAAADRLRATLQHAYDNVPHYRRAFDAAGRAPGRPEAARRPGEVPVHHQGRPARQLSLRHVRRAARAVRAHPRVVAAPPASPRSSATR
jgi:hypothetical protein